MVKKRIVCLANSRMRKKGYKCIAGKDIESGNWIRPIFNKSEPGLSWNERRYEDGSDPKVLDIIEVPLLGSYPHSGHQSENWLLASNSRLIWCEKFGWTDLANRVDDPEDLWGGRGVYGDRVKTDRIGKYAYSLYLIKLKGMVLTVSWGKVRGEFSYRDNSYNLVVTDPEVENCIKEPSSDDQNILELWQRQLAESDKLYNKYVIGECYVTVSLAAKPFEDHYYKLIAAIITPERAGERAR